MKLLNRRWNALGILSSFLAGTMIAGAIINHDWACFGLAALAFGQVFASEREAQP